MELASVVRQVTHEAAETVVYLRCVNNQTYLSDDASDTFEPDLVIGQIYEALPTTEAERSHGLVRIIDGSGDAYLYPAEYFMPVEMNGSASSNQ